MEINESLISNKSYTDKDFATIYPELLDLVKKLTNKWDPSQSVESDPGVVLLKLAAILADKNNYNIDKNVLETFPQTVTQLPNARRIYDMLGYNMHWYKSATVSLQFTYVGDFDFGSNGSITIPSWTQITDDSGSINFVTMYPTTISSRDTAIPNIEAREGIIHDYEVNGVQTITLDNLDSENRLFFTENNIAENGIFVFNVNVNTEQSAQILLNTDAKDAWEQVDNLEATGLNQKVFKFGVLPNSNSCYIQFSQDIGTLIGDGLRIKYLTSNGEEGNIQRGTLTSLAADLSIDGNTINNDLLIRNNSAAYGGAYPEEISSAYKNYKKTIGTFDTLVTTLDYHNAIYNLTDTNGNFLASNNVVSDRTDDLYWSEKVIKLTENGDVTELVSDDMTAFNIGLYVLYPFRDDKDTNGNSYNKSFSVNQIYAQNIKDGLDNKKCICHDYWNTIDVEKPTISSNTAVDAYLFKNFYKLRGKIITYYKVTDAQAKEIENNVKLALYRDYNAHEVEFGKPVDYDSIVETIQNADTRIKSVILGEPEYELKILKTNDTQGNYDSSVSLTGDNDYKALMKNILKKMVISGHVQLYDFNRDITFRFGQTNLTKYSNVQSIETSADLTINDQGTTLQKNQTLLFCAPNLITDTQYSSYVKYQLNGINSIDANVYHELGEGESITVSYTDTNETPIEKTISNVIVMSNQELIGNGDLGASGTLSILKPNTKELVGGDSGKSQVFCIFFTNDFEVSTADNNKITKYYLFREGEDKKLLGENEYFIYTNSSKNELVILGSGTLLTRKNDDTNVASSFSTKESEIIASGLDAIDSDGWYTYNPNGADDYLSVTEMQIVSMGEGVTVTFSGETTITNTLTDISNSITVNYTVDGTEYTLPQYSVPIDSDLHWYVKSSVNMAVSGSVSQEFSGSNELIINNGSDHSISNKSILSNYILAYAGGNKINTSDLGNGPLNIYAFEQADLPEVYTYDFSDNPTSTAKTELQYVSEEIRIPFQKVCGYTDYRSNIGQMEFEINPAQNDNGFPTDSKFILPIKLAGNQTIVEVYQKDDQDNYILIQLLCGDYIKPSSYEDANQQPIYDFISDGQTYYTRSGAGTDESPYVYTKVASPQQSDYADYYIKSNASTVICDFKNVTINYVTKNVELTKNDLEQIKDTLTIGQLRLYNNTAPYSNQFVTTYSGIDDTDNISDVVNTIVDSGFDTTYIVPNVDAIDTTTSPSDVENNLFKGNAVWDANHILNKYTIPQLNTKDSTITVAASSLQKNI